MGDRDRVEEQVLAVLNAHAFARREAGLEAELGTWLDPDLVLVAVRGRDGRQTRRRSVQRALARLCDAGLIESGIPGFRVLSSSVSGSS